ncbi:Na+:solute symporter [Saccharobesus litoralis]|uniref:Na+:solute symporter n=1 Tax=Saccharobesus litoralis TaxID=2172099 RepID=A0A2S0VMK3_9ALTE|nr:sodium:solute symporter family protein [Saccharobesus litoralis]AWB65412.1 Na+:solute symporter [Saccharobesus litoralis]
MATLDYIVLFLYLLGILAVGIVFANKNKNANDMFAAGGESPWWVSGLSAFMTMFSAGTFVVWGSIAFNSGFVAVAINLCYGISAVLVGYFIAGHWKKLGVSTPAEFITLRYGQAALKFYTFAMMVFRIVGTAVALYSLAVVVVALMPLPDGHWLQDPTTGNVAIFWAILLFGCIVVAYTVLGGLWAVLMTDVLQFIVLNLAVIFMVPLMLMKVGGWGEFVNLAPESFFDATSVQYSWYFLMGWVAIHFFMIGGEWAFAQRFISVPSEKEAKKATYLFGALYLFSPFLWLLPPLVYRVINPDANAEQAYVLATQAVLPVGMVGLMIAAMFSATASMVSSQLNVFAGVLTEDIYKKITTKANPDLVLVGRWFTVLLGAILVVVALAIPYLGGAEKVVVSITSLLVGPLLAPTIWGLFSRKVDISAIWWTVGLSFFAGVVLKFGLNEQGFLADINAFSAVAQWVQTQANLVNLTIGVIIPVSVLTVIHLGKSQDAPGAIAIDKVEQVQASKPQTQASNLPGLIVAVALGLCGLLMFGLAIANSADAIILGLFGLVLAVLAFIVYLLNSPRIHLKLSKTTS